MRGFTPVSMQRTCRLTDAAHAGFCGVVRVCDDDSFKEQGIIRRTPGTLAVQNRGANPGKPTLLCQLHERHMCVCCRERATCQHIAACFNRPSTTTGPQGLSSPPPGSRGGSGGSSSDTGTSRSRASAQRRSCSPRSSSSSSCSRSGGCG
jgi:hypothetical protein